MLRHIWGYTVCLCPIAVPIVSLLECLLWDREVVGPITGRVIPVAALLGAQHYKANTGFSSPENTSSLTLHV